MRNICFFSLLSVCLFCSCKKNSTAPTPYYGEFSVLINNKMWTGQVNVYEDSPQLFSIRVTKNDSDGIVEVLTIPFVRKTLGTHDINPIISVGTFAANMSFTATKEGDMVLKGYGALDSIKNAYTITQITNGTKEIWGTLAFDLYNNGIAGDTAKFTQGTFHIYPEGKPTQ